MTQSIYKICTTEEWQRAQATGRYSGSDVDRRDGFIHFSAAAQVKETAAKHFADQTDLVLVAVDPGRLGDALKWEPSRGGALFPHLYGDLAMETVLTVTPLPLGDDGRHAFPADVAP